MLLYQGLHAGTDNIFLYHFLFHFTCSKKCYAKSLHWISNVKLWSQNRPWRGAGFTH